MFNGDFHMEFCDNKRQLYQAYFRDFNIESLDRPWMAFTGGWHPDVAAKKLVKQYPDRVKVVRYEDLALDPLTKGEEIIEFYGLPFEKKVQKFLSSHTGVGHEEDPYSTFRDSKSTAFHWMEDLKYQEVTYYDIYLVISNII